MLAVGLLQMNSPVVLLYFQPEFSANTPVGGLDAVKVIVAF